MLFVLCDRLEVCVFQILGSPQRLYDLAGPCVAEPETRKRSFSKRKSHLDLLKLCELAFQARGATGEQAVVIGVCVLPQGDGRDDGGLQ